MLNNLKIFKKIIEERSEDRFIVKDIDNFDYKNNESFCMAPWIHLNISPSGDIPVCCNIINSKETVLGNVNDNTLEEIWNSFNMKNIRMKMLKGEKIKECSSCYKRETISRYSSMRNAFNDKYFHKYQDLVKKTKENGVVEKTNIVYFDFRFSNKCNFRCRTCGPHYSSSWEKKLNIKNKKIDNIKNLIEKTKELILNNSLKEIYFAGGETLITDEHWEIIDFLIENKKFDIEIRYNTNLSVLNYKGNNFLEKMKNFNDVLVSPSCDSLGIKGEYIRTGFSNDVFLRNIKLLKDHGYRHYITTVMSFFNVMYLYDFLKDLKDNDMEPNKVHFIIVTDTDLYDIYNIPEEMLNMVLIQIDKIINADFINHEKKEYFKILKESLINNCKFNEEIFKIRIGNIKFQDSINKLQFKDCFPDLYSLLSKYFDD